MSGKKENSSGNQAAAGAVGCLCKGCKTTVTQFGFCSEHFDQFKFGLVKKSGEPVPDFDKKIEHYQAFKKRQGARKVA